MRGYYRRLLGKMFGHAYGLADVLSSLIGIFLPPLLWAIGFQDADRIVGHLVWQIPLAAFVFAFLPRLLLAPYWMHQEDEAKRQTERGEEEKKCAELSAQLTAERTQREALLDQRTRRDEQRSCLSELLKEGDRLWADRVDNPERLKTWLRDYQAWIDKVHADVRLKFSDADAVKLSTLKIVIDRQVVSHGGEHQAALARISAVRDELHAMVRALSAKD